MAKTVEKPYPLGPHIPIFNKYKGVPPGGVVQRVYLAGCEMRVNIRDEGLKKPMYVRPSAVMMGSVICHFNKVQR